MVLDQLLLFWHCNDHRIKGQSATVMFRVMLLPWTTHFVYVCMHFYLWAHAFTSFCRHAYGIYPIPLYKLHLHDFCYFFYMTIPPKFLSYFVLLVELQVWFIYRSIDYIIFFVCWCHSKPRKCQSSHFRNAVNVPYNELCCYYCYWLV